MKQIMTMQNATRSKKILVDGRWQGAHGIGRFSSEILKRLSHADILTTGPRPLSVYNLIWQSQYLQKNKDQYRIFYSPGFNPVIFSKMPFVITIHDLIHLFAPNSKTISKNIYYQLFVKRSIRNAQCIITPSHYSKQTIANWAGIDEQKIVVVGGGLSDCFIQKEERFRPGYPYLLYVGNNKAHKNVIRLIQAFACSELDVHLILTCEPSREINFLIQQNKLNHKVHFHGTIDDAQLANYYRGALGLVFPSLYEGFGLPVIEAMACGTPVLTSNVTSLPEASGDAALLVDPYSVESIAHGMKTLVTDSEVRTKLILKGLEQVNKFSWDKTAHLVEQALCQLE